jgi:hypothetical protein
MEILDTKKGSKNSQTPSFVEKPKHNQMNQQPDQYFDLKGLSQYASLGVGTLRDYLSAGDLPHFRLKGKILVRRSEFDQWLEGFRVEKKDIRAIAGSILKKLKSDS